MSEAVTTQPTIRLLSWNLGAGGPGPKATWGDVVAQGAGGVDAAMLQEAPNPLGTIAAPSTVPSPGSRWGIGMNRAQAAVAVLSERVEITPVPTQPLGFDGPLELGVSRPGTIAVARLKVRSTGEEILLASIYAQWEGPMVGGTSIFADASMHRILSDLSPLLSWAELPMIVAGDFNTVLGADLGHYGGNWPMRDASVFARFEALGLRLAGPQGPAGGVQADPHPVELPPGSGNVPTFGATPPARSRQLDYCFASAEIVDRLNVVALNGIDEWGPSDHCRVVIDLEPPRVRAWTRASILAEVAVAQGPTAVTAVEDLFDWAEREGLRLEYGTGHEGQWYAQLDGTRGGTQFTFSVRTRGDIVIQFRWMKAPFDMLAARDALRLRINEAIAVPFADIGAERLNGLPTIPLQHLLDPARRQAFLLAFSEMLSQTRTAIGP